MDRGTRLLIYSLFQKGRVLAQDGIDFLRSTADRRGPINDSVNVRFSDAGRITPSVEADFGGAASIAGSTAGFRPGADTERERR